MLGPYTSASINPTFAPKRRSVSAIAAATVLLPTPPLPLPTAMTLLIRKTDLAQASRRTRVIDDIDQDLAAGCDGGNL